MVRYFVQEILMQTHAHGEDSYPEERVSLLITKMDADLKHMTTLIRFDGIRRKADCLTRYLLTPSDFTPDRKEVTRLRSRYSQIVLHSP